MYGEIRRLDDAILSVREQIFREAQEAKKAVENALTSRSELFAAQGKAATAAIEKSEKATADALTSLKGNIEDVKISVAALSLQVTGIIKSDAGRGEQIHDSRDAGRYNWMIVLAVLSVIGAIVGVVTFFLGLHEGRP